MAVVEGLHSRLGEAEVVVEVTMLRLEVATEVQVVVLRLLLAQEGPVVMMLVVREGVGEVLHLRNRFE